jgi:hypothetical protein
LSRCASDKPKSLAASVSYSKTFKRLAAGPNSWSNVLRTPDERTFGDRRDWSAKSKAVVEQNNATV